MIDRRDFQIRELKRDLRFAQRVATWALAELERLRPSPKERPAKRKP